MRLCCERQHMLGMTSRVQGLGCLYEAYSKGIHWSKRVITSNKTSSNGTKNRINQSVSISPKTKWSASWREGGRHAGHDSAATWRPAAPVPNTQPLTPNLGPLPVLIPRQNIDGIIESTFHHWRPPPQ